MQTKQAKRYNFKHWSRPRVGAALLVALLMFALGGQYFESVVRAASCSTSSDCYKQIQQLNAANSANKAALSDLLDQASSYQDVINRLRAQIAALQNQIAQNKAKQAQLQQQIIEKQKEIEQQRVVLGDVLRSMYVDGEMSTIEMLATSNNLSDYVDKEEYRNSVQGKIQEALQAITLLQSQLQTKKAQVEGLIKTAQAQKSQVEASKAQQSKLLAYNASQQAAYNARIAANRKSIGSLEARLAALNTTSGSRVTASGTCGGTYPAKATGRNGSWGCAYAKNYNYDNWGMYNRQCVSYTAWMVHKEYLAGRVRYDMPYWGGHGNAYRWIDNARSAGIPVDQTPQPGDIAIRDVNWSVPGDVGHAMYVKTVYSSHDIVVWEYNRNYDGKFTERRFDPYDYSAPVYYLHFRDWVK